MPARHPRPARRFASAPPYALQLLDALPGSEALLNYLAERQCAMRARTLQILQTPHPNPAG
eukprot:810947-Prymnesium_polylepis.1